MLVGCIVSLMDILTPAQVNSNRTARLVREATTPVYSTDTDTARRLARRALLAQAEEIGCTDDYCFVCGRATEHFGEHTEEQLLNFAHNHPHFKRMTR